MPRVIHNWTESEKQFLRSNYLKHTQNDLAEMLSKDADIPVSRDAVRKMLQVMGLSTPKEIKYSRHATVLREVRNRKEEQRNKKPHPYSGMSVLAGVFFAYNAWPKDKRYVRITTDDKKPITFDDIANDICTIFDIPLTALLGDTKREAVVFARYIFCLVAKRIKRATQRAIADYLRYSEHTVVGRGQRILNDGIRNKDPKLSKAWFKYVGETKVYRKN